MVQNAGMGNRDPGVDTWFEYPKSTKHVSLMFHTGAALPDPTGLLEGEGDTSRVARFLDESDLAAKEAALRGLVAAWIDLKS